MKVIRYLKILDKNFSDLSYVLLTLFILALTSYFFFPKPITYFHTYFLNNFTPGLSLVKPVAFFAFLAMGSIISDILAYKNYSTKKWFAFQSLALLSLFIIASISLSVFSGNIALYNSMAGTDITIDGSTRLEYINYNANSPFFYTVSRPIHLHEAKAILSPLALVFPLKGDIGEPIAPFYPKTLILAGYILLTVFFLSFVNMLRMMRKRKVLDIFIFFFYLLLNWRLLTITIDGGVFHSFYIPDIILTYVFGGVYAYYRSPKDIHLPFLSYILYWPGIIILHHLSKLILNWKDIPVPALATAFTNYTLQLSIFVTLLILLSKQIPRFSHSRQWTPMLFYIFALVTVFTFIAVDLSNQQFMTAVDPDNPAGRLRGLQPQYIVATTQENYAPCSTIPLRVYHINTANVFIYRFNETQNCDTRNTFYGQIPRLPESEQDLLFVGTCNSSTGFCLVHESGVNPFYLYDLSESLQDQKIFRATRRALPLVP